MLTGQNITQAQAEQPIIIDKDLSFKKIWEQEEAKLAAMTPEERTSYLSLLEAERRARQDDDEKLLADEEAANHERAFFARVSPRVMEVLPDKQPDEIRQQIRRMARSGGFISGPVGTGKTVMLERVCYVRRKQSTLHRSAAQWAERLKDVHTYRQEVRACQRAAFLVIDDAGIEKTTEHSLEQIFAIVDFRYERGKPILMSSNMPLFDASDASIASVYGERVADRLREMWHGEIMVLMERKRCV